MYNCMVCIIDAFIWCIYALVICHKFVHITNQNSINRFELAIILCETIFNKGNAKRGVSPRLILSPRQRDIVTLPSVRLFVRPSFRPSFRNILVNTLTSISFNGFWPNLVNNYLRKIPVERRQISRVEWRGKLVSRLVFFRKYPSHTWYGLSIS
jgi:hypothetical protein